MVFFTSCRENGTTKFLTKGDNNRVDDRGLYAPGQLWLTPKDVVGRARGFLPYVGMVTIMMNEYPKLKVKLKFKLSLESNKITIAYLFINLVCCFGLSRSLCVDSSWINFNIINFDGRNTKLFDVQYFVDYIFFKQKSHHYIYFFSSSVTIA